MTSFPKTWFYIKNQNNGYVLSSEKISVGEPVIISVLKNANDSQLWSYDKEGRIHNKMTGYVLDIAPASPNAGVQIILKNSYEPSENQHFDVSSEGSIYLKQNPDLVLGIKESFFTRNEGLQLHLQSLDNNSADKKQQRWEFVLPADESFVDLGKARSLLGRTATGISSSSSEQDEDSLDDSHENQLNSFPEKDFFLKSDTTGHFLGIDINAVNSSGARLSLDPLRKSNYESQLWHFDKLTGRLINKHSGFCLTAEGFKEDSFVYQSSSLAYKDLPHQSWFFTNAGEVKLKAVSHGHFVLGFRTEGWYNLNREGSAVLLQRQLENKEVSHQKFTVVLPIFRRKTAEIVTVTEQQGVFPKGFFFIKNQKHGLVISVDEANKLAAQVLASELDPKSFNRQLWRYENGFLYNKVSKLVLDVKGGNIASGSEICQYSQKNQDYENQQWEMSVDGYIYPKSHKATVLAISEKKKDGTPIFLANRTTPDHEEQRWNFILPVIKKKSSSVTETTVQTVITSHQYAQYPSGFFFIRSFVGGTSNNTPFVFTSDRRTHNIYLTPISKENWRSQLWTYCDGSLVNFASQLAVDLDNLIFGTNVCQELRQKDSISQRFYLTVEGYFIHGSDPSLTLIPEEIPNDDQKYRIVLAEYEKARDTYRWGFLTPETKVEQGIQSLVRWSVTLLTEWKRTEEQKIQKMVHRIADWPEETFFIIGQDDLALIPEKAEVFSFVTLKKLDYEKNEYFKWTFNDGYLVHVATGLVLHAADDLVGGGQLQIRERLFDSSNTIDQRQRWLIKTDGSIVSEAKTELGFSLIQQENQYLVQLTFVNETNEHYAWNIVQGKYESRYSETHKKHVNVITHTERVLLSVRTQHNIRRSNTKLITTTFGVFPENWFYICSKADKLLVLTVPSKDEGAKLILSKLELKKFREQLWRLQDDGCLVNLATGYVIDVAGGAMNAGDNIIQWHQKYLKRYRKNQLWALSTDGHIHPKSHPSLVLGPKESKAVEGAEIQLHMRGALDAYHQLWTFTIPIFRRTGATETKASFGILEKDDASVYIESVKEFTFETSSSEKYTSESKITVVHRWGVFPEGQFFIRCSYGNDHLALSVEKSPRTGQDKHTEHEVALRPIDFKECQWHLWYYEDGHLLNVKTGLALDASPTKGVLVEQGLRIPLFVRQKSMSDNQFWSLTVNSEIFLRSDERLVIGASGSSRAVVSGAQVGLQQVRLHKYINEAKQQETSIQSEKWLQWVFSKPIYNSKTREASATNSSSIVSSVTGSLFTASSLVTSGETIEGFTDEKIIPKHKEETVDEFEDNESDSTDESITTLEGSSSSKLNILGGIGASVGILTGATGIISKVFSAAPESMISETDTTREVTSRSTVAKYDDRKDSFNLDIDYVPTGSEKVLRYKTYQQLNFPTTGYFMIKSYLNGLVLDVVDAQPKSGSYVVLAPIKSTDFASQLWSYKNGRLVNVKCRNLVLNVSSNSSEVSGERLTLSSQSEECNQSWILQTSSGFISLKSKSNLVLGIKDIKRRASLSKTMDVYIQEEMNELTEVHVARPEQRWEVLIPCMVPISQNTSEISESRYTIIESGKISCISSSASAIIAFESLKKTILHKISTENQWPSSRTWFFIRAGTENAFLSSGLTDSSEVKFVTLKEKEDHKQYLWMHFNGYLVNYKYMLRLIYDRSSKKLILSKDTKTLGQTFHVSSKGSLFYKEESETMYFSVTSSSRFLGEGRYYQLNVSKQESKSQDNMFQMHIPVYENLNVEKESKIALTAAISWMQTTQQTTSITSSTSSSTMANISQKYGLFPANTWFFIKAITKSTDSFVLAVKESSKNQGASLVLSKLNFKNYQGQLWTFRDGLLINYGSKMVIDINGDIRESTVLIQSSEAGVSTQKWCLSANGRIKLDSYSGYALGCSTFQSIDEGLEIVLVKENVLTKDIRKNQVLEWKFSVPIFKSLSSKTESTEHSTKSTSVSTTENATLFIESGSVIEHVEEEETKIEHMSVQESISEDTTHIQSTAASTKNNASGLQNMLSNTGIAVASLGVAEGASKLIEKVTKTVESTNTDTKLLVQNEEKHVSSESKKKENTYSSTSSNVTSSSSVTDISKTAETVTVYRTKHSSVEVIEESRTIVQAWRIIFVQRIHKCKSKVEMIQVIEESREDLFKRLDEHLRVHASIEGLISGSVPDWHVSIQQVKEIYRARIFENLLNRLKSESIATLKDLDFDIALKSTTEEIETHYKLLIEKQSQEFSKHTSNSVEQLSQVNQETTLQDNLLVSVDTIKVTVRYWMINLLETISIAKRKGTKEADLQIIIQNSRDELSKELAKIKVSASSVAYKSSSKALSSKLVSIDSSINNAIIQTESIVDEQVKSIHLEKSQTFSEEYWSEITRTTEESLSSKLKVYQNSVIQEIFEARSQETDESQKAEIVIVTDQKQTALAQDTVTKKLLETQTKISIWFTEISQSVSLLIEESESHNMTVHEIKQNILAILNASQIELVTRIEEAKLVLRAHYTQLTYLSWAERHRLEYSLENIKTIIAANIMSFKRSIERTDITKEHIHRCVSCSFGATVSRLVIDDIQSTIVKVTNSKESISVVNKTEEINAQKNQASITTGSSVEIKAEKRDAHQQSSCSVKSTITEKENINQQTSISESHASNFTSESIRHTEEQKKQDKKESTFDFAKKAIVTTAAAVVGTTVALEAAKKLKQHEEEAELAKIHEKKTIEVVEDIQLQYSKWISSLTETVVSKSKKVNVTEQEIITTIEQSKSEFIKAIRQAKASELVKEKHQQEILLWIEQIATIQASRIQEVAVSSQSPMTINLASRLEVINISISQEVNSALEKCKDFKHSTSYVGVTADQLKQREFALLDIQRELDMVIQDARSSLILFFQEFTKSVTSRIQTGGADLEKDVASLVTNARNNVNLHTEKVKNSATKRISAIETKSSQVIDIASVTVLSGMASAALLTVVHYAETLFIQSINRAHSSVWFVEKSQDTSEIIKKIVSIESETTTKVSQTLESAKHDFVTSATKYNKQDYASLEVSKEGHSSQYVAAVLDASLSIQEVKITVREWLRNLAEKTSLYIQSGKSSEEIEILLKQENHAIYNYLDASTIKIAETTKSEEGVAYLHSIVKQVKSNIDQVVSKTKTIAVETSSSKDRRIGGFDRITSVIVDHEVKISESLSVCQTKFSAKIYEETRTKESSTSSSSSVVISKKNVAVEYILLVFHNMFEELIFEISEHAKYEHDSSVVSEKISLIIKDHTAYFDSEFGYLIDKVQKSNASASSKEALVNTIKWAAGMIIQTSAQFKVIGVDSATSFNVTGGIDQMRALASTIEKQLEVSLSYCDKSVQIEVEQSSKHYVQHKSKIEYRKRERESKRTSKGKSSEHKRRSSSSSDSSSCSNSDTDNRRDVTFVDASKFMSEAQSTSISVIVSDWYEELIIDVSKRAKEGGIHASSDINVIIQKATQSITEKLRVYHEYTKSTLTDVQKIEKHQASIEWVQQLVLQSTLQIKTIGINAAKSGSSTGGMEQMRPILVSIQEQVKDETRRYKTSVEQESVSSTMTKSGSKQSTNVDYNGYKVASSRTDYLKHVDNSLTSVVSESNNLVILWISQLIRDISLRVHQGGKGYEQEVNEIIIKSRSRLDSELKETYSKFCSSVEIYGKDQTVSLIDAQVQESFNTVKFTIDSKLEEVKKIVSSSFSTSMSINKKLSSLLESTKSQITETFESSKKKSTSYITQKSKQIESSTTIVKTVDYVKETVTKWQTKLANDIYLISIDETITNKEERIIILIKQASSEVERVSLEAKSNVSQKFNGMSTVSKTKEQEILRNIDVVCQTFSNDAKKVQQLSIESIKRSDKNIKNSITSVLKSSGSRMDALLTGITATFVGATTSAIGSSKTRNQDRTTEEKHTKNILINTEENASLVSKWFSVYTEKISSSVLARQSDTLQRIDVETQQSEKELNEVISYARANFIESLSAQKLDKESYNYACKHYEESLEALRTSILSQVIEVKQLAIESHTTGNLQEFARRLNAVSNSSNEKIKTLMGSSVAVSYKPNYLEIEVEGDKEYVIGTKNVYFDTHEVDVDKQESSESHHETELKRTEKVSEEKKSSNVDGFFKNAFSVGSIALAGTGAYIQKKKDTVENVWKRQDIFTTYRNLHHDSGISVIENFNATINKWSSCLIQEISEASKSGLSYQSITTIVEERTKELDQIIKFTKITGSKYCTSSKDEQEFINKIECISSVVKTQASQIQEIGIKSLNSKTDMTSYMTSLVASSHSQIDVTLEQLKTNIRFEKKTSTKRSSTRTEATRAVEDLEVKHSSSSKTEATSTKKTSAAYTILQDTRVTTVALFSSLSDRIVSRLKQGGSNVQEDINEMIESTQQEVNTVFSRAKTSSVNVDQQTQIEIDQALLSVQKSVQEQIIQVKTTTVQATSSSTIDTNYAISKVLEVSNSSKTMIESSFNSVSETFFASLAAVTQTAQKATATVQEWYTGLSSSLTDILESKNYSEKEKQSKVDRTITKAETEIESSIDKLEQSATRKSSENSSSHFGGFYGSLKSGIGQQLNTIKNTVKEKADTSKVVSAIKSSEDLFKKQVKTEYEEAEKKTREVEQSESQQSSSYRDKIGLATTGAVALAASAAMAIDQYTKSQVSSSSTETVSESSIQEVQHSIDSWFTRLTERVTLCIKNKGTQSEVETIVKESQSELDVYIRQVQTRYISSGKSEQLFEATLEHIKNTSLTQVSQITQIVKQSSTSSTDLISQIESHVTAVKKQVHSSLQVHCSSTSSIHAVSSSSSHTSLSSSSQVTETKKQVQRQFTEETTAIIQLAKKELASYLILLQNNLTDVLYSNSSTIRKDIYRKLHAAQEIISIMIRHITEQLAAIEIIQSQHDTLVMQARKQTLDCVSSTQSTILHQFSVLREELSHFDVEELSVISERIKAIMTRAQTRLKYTLDTGIQLAISSAFEGQSMTWPETTALPRSFSEVRVLAFDVLDTVTDYRKSIRQVLQELDIERKSLDTIIQDWYVAYVDTKRETLYKKRYASDANIRRETLDQVLKRHKVKSLSQVEIEQLCRAWVETTVYDDFSIGIRRLKKQKHLASVAFSESLSTRSLVEMSQNNCLCWNGQFSSDMFESALTEATINGTIRLLGLEHPKELAIVSSNQTLVDASKRLGCHAIFIDRSGLAGRGFEDVKMDGVDVLGETIQLFEEHESMVQHS